MTLQGKLYLSLGFWAFVVFGAILVTVVYNAVPGLMTPTVGQAVWLAGFAESMSLGPLIQLRADEIGGPRTHIPAFGYSGALPLAVLIEFGVSMSVAYTIMFAAYLGAAGFGSFALARRLGSPPIPGVIFAVCWLLLPTFWAHVVYSMLSIGFAWLAVYLLAVLWLCDDPVEPRNVLKRRLPLFTALCFFAVFTDGYTFVMFASLFGIVWAHRLLSLPARRAALITQALPVASVGFGVAYLVYSVAVGSSDFPKSGLSFFRGWGADLTYLVQPVRGELWLFDALGVSAERPEDLHYGDRSVSFGSFILPLLLATFAAAGLYWKKRAIIFVLVAMAGLYMSLGPSFKVAQTKAPSEQPVIVDAKAGVPTGTGLISGNLPGFDSMRASYRWSAMGQLGLWCVLVLCLSEAGASRSRGAMRYVLPCLVIVGSMPALGPRAALGMNNKSMIDRMEADLAFLGERLVGQDRVLFYPHGNDFGANWIAPVNGFGTYNIGGDKNVALARAGWPPGVRAAGQGTEPLAVLLPLFRSGDVSAVVVPKFDLLLSIHSWPPVRNREDIAYEVGQAFRDRPSFEVFENDFAVIVRASDASAITQFEPLNYALRGAPFYSQTGVFGELGLISEGSAGYALFGPYVPISAGRYVARFESVSLFLGSATVDIVSTKARTVHAPAITFVPDTQGRVAIPFTVSDSVDDLEIRIRVTHPHNLSVGSISVHSD